MGIETIKSSLKNNQGSITNYQQPLTIGYCSLSIDVCEGVDGSNPWMLKESGIEHCELPIENWF
jgi:hypothetical protein